MHEGIVKRAWRAVCPPEVNSCLVTGAEGKGGQNSSSESTSCSKSTQGLQTENPGARVHHTHFEFVNGAARLLLAGSIVISNTKL